MTALTDSHIFVGDSSNVATDVAMSGDATIDYTGAVIVTIPLDRPVAHGTSTDLQERRLSFCTGSTGLRITGKNNCYRGLTDKEKLV